MATTITVQQQEKLQEEKRTGLIKQARRQSIKRNNSEKCEHQIFVGLGRS